VSDRVSQTILLCEDRPQAALVRSYMDRCGLNTKAPVLLSLIASERAHGGNVNWVLREFPRQLQACRRRQARAKTLLIVVLDADNRSVDQRYADLDKALETAEFGSIDFSDPTVVLVPKRHIEPWIRAATAADANETDDYKFPQPTREKIREAAQRIHDWTHDDPVPDEDSCLPSLRRSFPEWRKIG
jgi:hypothetical protein